MVEVRKDNIDQIEEVPLDPRNLAQTIRIFSIIGPKLIKQLIGFLREYK